MTTAIFYKYVYAYNQSSFPSSIFRFIFEVILVKAVRIFVLKINIIN